MATVSPHVASLTTIVGRQAELRDLRAAFVSDTRVHVLTGMGGVGKTCLARSYAQQHLNDYDLIWWIRAEDPAAIDAEFRSLLDVLLPPGQATQINDARTKAFDLLAHHQGPWLLVLDNVIDAAGGISLLPPAGIGHVLITSRAPDWPAARTVQPLGTEAAVELLTTQSSDRDEAAAMVLAIELGGLPLALTQAAAFVRTNHISLAAYVRLYHDRSAELLKEGRLPDYPHTVATTWQLAIDQLSDLAREMLNVLAFYAPDAIPVDLLFASWDELDRHRALGELYAYSLITRAVSNTVNVHRLVQAVTRNRLHVELVAHEWADKARALITAALPKLENIVTNLTIWHSLRTHVHRLLDHLPPERPDTLDLRFDLAKWIWAAGDATRARDINAELFVQWNRMLGAEHPNTLSSRFAVANLTGWAGDPTLARDLSAELVPIYERIYGVEHPQTLQCRTLHAWWTGDAGDAITARDLHAELAFIRERVFGADHLSTLIERHNVAQWTGHAGDAKRARELFAELVDARTRVLGAESPHTLVAQHHWAWWIGRSGDPTSARDSLAKLLPIMERVLGPEHPHTLSARHSLASWMKLGGAVSEARTVFAELLPYRQRILSVVHPDTSQALHDPAHWTDGPGLAEGSVGDGGAEAGVEVAEEGAVGAEFEDAETGGGG